MIMDDGLATEIFQTFLPEALQEQRFKPSLSISVVGHGLDSIQDGLNILQAGVTATKVVITL